MKYYISDLHLFHENAIKFDNRPFSSIPEMHDAILKNWNDRVTNGDYVYILGDVSMRGKNEDLIAFVAKLKGRKVLVRGNHDDVSDYRYQQLFAEICDYKEIYDSIGKEKYGLVLCHYPIFPGRRWGVERFCCTDIRMRAKKTGFISSAWIRCRKATADMSIITN